MARRSGSGAGARRTLRALLAVGAIVLLSAPLSVLATILLLPVWSWLESSAGLEAIGHSGPAAWCYFVAFAIFVGAGVLLFRARGGRGAPKFS